MTNQQRSEGDRVSGLSEHDPPPEGGRGGPPVALVVLIVLVVIAVVALHLAGVIGPGSH